MRIKIQETRFWPLHNMSQIEGSNTESFDKEDLLKSFLKSNGLSAYTRNFISEGYDIEMLQEVEQDDLNDICKDLNLPVKHKLKLKKAIKKLKSQQNVPHTPISSLKKYIFHVTDLNFKIFFYTQIISFWWPHYATITHHNILSLYFKDIYIHLHLYCSQILFLDVFFGSN